MVCRRTTCTLFFFISLYFHASSTIAEEHWFETFKKEASDEQLYRFLYAMPKGGDLHHHLSGSNFSEWWFELATDFEKNGGYRYYTKTKILLCNGSSKNEFGSNRQLLLFKTIQHSRYAILSDCEKQEYQLMSELSSETKRDWLNSVRLNQQHEGREEFFEAHWSRLNDLMRNPHILAEMLVKNMEDYAKENARYFETQIPTANQLAPDGSQIAPELALKIYQKRINQPDAKATGVTVRFQYMLLRFAKDAEEQLRWIYQFVNANRDWYVGINMAGREDNDKGYPLRFLSVFRELRQQYPSISLSLHAGEVDEPNSHVRDTLLLGATRIGHGLNLITDPQTMLLMRNSHYLVEINLISNLLLEYVEDYAQHPFPEYLRTGIPVALSTDDRGMWDSRLTDEFFVAVKEFNLTWQEIKALTINSIQFSFLQEEIKSSIRADLEAALSAFEVSRSGYLRSDSVGVNMNRAIQTRHFMCANYAVCINTRPE